jgi:hypothetical protein
MYIKDFSISGRTGYEDDIWDTRDEVFINCLSVRCCLFAQKLSASPVELGFLDEFLGPRVLVFVKCF